MPSAQHIERSSGHDQRAVGRVPKRKLVGIIGVRNPHDRSPGAGNPRGGALPLGVIESNYEGVPSAGIGASRWSAEVGAGRDSKPDPLLPKQVKRFIEAC